MRPRNVGLAAVVMAVVVAGAAWMIWPSSTGKPAPRARQYVNFTQCLLTDAAGVNSASARPVWAAMQQSSAQTAAKSQFLAIPASAAKGESAVYANTLVARGCDVIVAAGAEPVRVAAAAAGSTPAKHFVLIGEAVPVTNAVVVASDKPDPASVAAILTAAFHGHFTPGTVAGQ